MHLPRIQLFKPSAESGVFEIRMSPPDQQFFFAGVYTQWSEIELRRILQLRLNRTKLLCLSIGQRSNTFYTTRVVCCIVSSTQSFCVEFLSRRTPRIFSGCQRICAFTHGSLLGQLLIRRALRYPRVRPQLTKSDRS